jgi:UDP-N-acetylmuramate dehydrogenase
MTLSQDRSIATDTQVRDTAEASNNQESCVAPPNSSFRQSVPLNKLTTWKVGGLAEWYMEPKTIADAQMGMSWAKKCGLAVTIIGAGSNLLISDKGLPGLVICTRHLHHIENQFDSETGVITVDAGKMVGNVAWLAARRGWSGLEWAAGIPGTVGGAVVMNAGAHTHSTEEVLISTEVLNADGSIEVLTNQDLNYSYRTSNLQGDSRLVISATFQLKEAGTPEDIKARTFRDLEKRHSKQPYDRPSCGSVFRNPDPLYAAALIEGLGLKGYRIGEAEVSTLHANFIINRQNATASDIHELIYYVQSQVQQHHGIELEPEVKMLGDFSK